MAEAKAAQYKKDAIQEIVDLIDKYPIVGAVDLENLPANALQDMRSKLRGKAEIRMTKRRLLKIAFEEAEKKKKGILQLSEKLRGMPALIFTNENPFTIYKIIKENKSPAPAKAGQIAPKEVVVKAGATPFMPGPIIGELGAFKIKTAVENGKIAIKEDCVVAKEGDEISGPLASILTRLDIKPMEIGLNLVSIYEGGVLYGRDTLDIDQDAFLGQLNQAATWARNLAVEVGFLTKETVQLVIVKAFNDAKGLALEANIMNDLTKEAILAKAEAQANAVKANVKDAPVESKPEEKKEESDSKAEMPEEKTEEKPAEAEAEAEKKQ